MASFRKVTEQPTASQEPDSLDRRAFIRAAGGMVAAATLGACDSGTEPPPPPPPGVDTGTVTVAVTGLEGATGGTIGVTLPDGTDAGVSVPLPAPANGTSVGTATGVPVGTYRLTYTPPSDHTVADPDDFEDVTVVKDQVSPVAFTVQAMGTLTVMVTGYASSATDPGSAEVQETDGTPTGIAIDLPAPAAGASEASATHPTGDYQVVFVPPSMHRLNGSDTEPVTVVVGESTAASFVVEEVPPLAFASDWSTDVGATVNAVGDGGKWDLITNLGGNNLVVVPAAGLGFPSGMSNVLAVNLNGTPSSKTAIQNKFSELAIGETRYWRLYQRMSSDQATDNSIHIPQMTEAGGAFPFELNTNIQSGATYRQQFPTGLFSPTSPTDYYHIYELTLDRDTVYRFEFSIERLGTNFIHIEFRVYDSSDVLIATNQDIGCVRHGFSHYADDNVHDNEEPTANGYFNTDLWVKTRNWMFASPGEDNPGAHYYGGFAVSNSDWCGPWVAGEGP